MSNRFYSENKQRNLEGSTKPRPSVGYGNGPTPTVNGADDPPYNADIGPGGPDLNVVGFPRVRVYMKSKMSPEQDASGELATGIAKEVTPTMPEWFNQGVDKGGKMAGRIADTLKNMQDPDRQYRLEQERQQKQRDDAETLKRIRGR